MLLEELTLRKIQEIARDNNIKIERKYDGGKILHGETQGDDIKREYYNVILGIEKIIEFESGISCSGNFDCLDLCQVDSEEEAENILIEILEHKKLKEELEELRRWRFERDINYANMCTFESWCKQMKSEGKLKSNSSDLEIDTNG